MRLLIALHFPLLMSFVACKRSTVESGSELASVSISKPAANVDHFKLTVDASGSSKTFDSKVDNLQNLKLPAKQSTFSLVAYQGDVEFAKTIAEPQSVCPPVVKSLVAGAVNKVKIVLCKKGPDSKFNAKNQTLAVPTVDGTDTEIETCIAGEAGCDPAASPGSNNVDPVKDPNAKVNDPTPVSTPALSVTELVAEFERLRASSIKLVESDCLAVTLDCVKRKQSQIDEYRQVLTTLDESNRDVVCAALERRRNTIRRGEPNFSAATPSYDAIWTFDEMLRTFESEKVCPK